METSRQTLKENAISFFNGKSTIQSEMDKKFVNYLEAYCHDLKTTEWDILLNEKNLNKVFDIFESLFITEKVSV